MPRVAPANETGAPRTSGGHLLFVSDGMVSVATGDTVWALWPQRALWVPTGTPYRIYDRASATIFELSLDRVGDLPSATRLVIVSPLFRELIIEEDRLMADGRDRKSTRLNSSH